MKNLKKILSLVLALAMALSLMTFAFAKDTGDFADGDDVSYAEAVDVMATIGVFNGTGDGTNFDPNGTLTREQAAKIITYMIMGQAQADKLVATIAPFADVSADRWSAGAIAYCASEGIMNGTGNGKFNPTGELTGLQFSKMLLVALGYDAEIEDMTGAAWGLATSKLAYAVELDDGMDDINLTDVMTREQAAQMALTTMKTPLVEYPDKGTTITVNGAVVEFGAQKAQYVTSTIAREQTISSQQLTNSEDFTVEFAEKYCPKLELIPGEDDFGRPDYTWSYDKKEINNYVDYTDLVAEFTTKVTGKDLYDAITSNVMGHLYGGDVTVFIDGETSAKVNPDVFTEAKIRRSNTDAVGATEKGVLTQVFVTNHYGKNQTEYEVKIVIQNTYLAIAAEDYDTKNEDVTLDVYALNKVAGSDKDNLQYIKDRGNESFAVTVKADDIDVTEVEEDEIYLVTVAQGKVQEMIIPEVLSDVSIDSFKKQKDVTVEGTTYQYAHTAKYDVEVLDAYSQTNLKDITYNVILDPYGYLIGIEQNEDPDQYVFLTGMNGNTSDLATKNADANVIFLDGTMETVSVNVAKSDLTTESGPQMNTWCTYSVNSAGVYTLEEVANDEAEGWKVNQNAQDVTGANEVKINNKNVSLSAVGGNAYGNDDTVYLNVTTDVIKAATDADSSTHTGKYWHVIIDDVDSVTVGVKNASLTVANQTVAGTGAEKEDSTPATPTGDGPKPIDKEIYTLYKENGYIIAAVTIGEDDGVNKVYAYVHSKTGAEGINRESYSKTDDEWTWTREVIVDGKITELKEVGDGTGLSELKKMDQGAWYEVKLDANGNVKKVEKQAFAAFADGTNEDRIDNVDDVDDAVNAKDTVIMQVDGMVEGTNKLTYKNGTLYTDKSNTEGFYVSPEVATVLCLSDGEGGLYDDVDDRFTGRSGLESAIKNLDSNFTGELNVVFDKGDAVVIILVDTTEGEGDGDDGDDGNQNNGETNAAAVVNEAALTIDSVTTVDGDYKTPIANALSAKGLRVTGWNEQTAGTPADGDTVTAVDEKGTVFTFEFGTAAAAPTEYWTVTVDGTSKEVLDGEDDTRTWGDVKPTTDAGTGYQLNGTTYTAYGADSAKVATNVTAKTTISTGYVSVTAATDYTATVNGLTAASFALKNTGLTTSGVKVNTNIEYVLTYSGTETDDTDTSTITFTAGSGSTVVGEATLEVANNTTVAAGTTVTFTAKATGNVGAASVVIATTT